MGFDITYCALNGSNYECPKKDTCRRYAQQKEIPPMTPVSQANLYNICKEQNDMMYIPYEVKVEVKDEAETK